MMTATIIIVNNNLPVGIPFVPLENSHTHCLSEAPIPAIQWRGYAKNYYPHLTDKTFEGQKTQLTDLSVGNIYLNGLKISTTKMSFIIFSHVASVL